MGTYNQYTEVISQELKFGDSSSDEGELEARGNRETLSYRSVECVDQPRLPSLVPLLTEEDSLPPLNPHWVEDQLHSLSSAQSLGRMNSADFDSSSESDTEEEIKPTALIERIGLQDKEDLAEGVALCQGVRLLGSSVKEWSHSQSAPKHSPDKSSLLTSPLPAMTDVSEDSAAAQQTQETPAIQENVSSDISVPSAPHDTSYTDARCGKLADDWQVDSGISIERLNPDTTDIPTLTHQSDFANKSGKSEGSQVQDPIWEQKTLAVQKESLSNHSVQTNEETTESEHPDNLIFSTGVEESMAVDPVASDQSCNLTLPSTGTISEDDKNDANTSAVLGNNLTQPLETELPMILERPVLADMQSPVGTTVVPSHGTFPTTTSVSAVSVPVEEAAIPHNPYVGEHIKKEVQQEGDVRDPTGESGEQDTQQELADTTTSVLQGIPESVNASVSPDVELIRSSDDSVQNDVLSKGLTEHNEMSAQPDGDVGGHTCDSLEQETQHELTDTTTGVLQEIPESMDTDAASEVQSVQSSDDSVQKEIWKESHSHESEAESLMEQDKMTGTLSHEEPSDVVPAGEITMDLDMEPVKSVTEVPMEVENKEGDLAISPGTVSAISISSVDGSVLQERNLGIPINHTGLNQEKVSVSSEVIEKSKEDSAMGEQLVQSELVPSDKPAASEVPSNNQETIHAAEILSNGSVKSEGAPVLERLDTPVEMPTDAGHDESVITLNKSEDVGSSQTGISSGLHDVSHSEPASSLLTGKGSISLGNTDTTQQPSTQCVDHMSSSSELESLSVNPSTGTTLSDATSTSPTSHLTALTVSSSCMTSNEGVKPNSRTSGLIEDKDNIDLLTCKNCHKILQDPVILPCSHVICRNLCGKHLITVEKSLTCPTCKKESLLETGIEGLASAEVIVSMIGDLQKERNTNNESGDKTLLPVVVEQIKAGGDSARLVTSTGDEHCEKEIKVTSTAEERPQDSDVPSGGLPEDKQSLESQESSDTIQKESSTEGSELVMKNVYVDMSDAQEISEEVKTKDGLQTPSESAEVENDKDQTEFRCKNCGELLNVPVILPCSHIICRNRCGKKIITSENKLICPTCEKECILEKGIEGLFVARELEKRIRKHLSRKHGKEQRCETVVRNIPCITPSVRYCKSSMQSPTKVLVVPNILNQTHSDDAKGGFEPAKPSSARSEAPSQGDPIKASSDEMQSTTETASSSEKTGAQPSPPGVGLSDASAKDNTVYTTKDYSEETEKSEESTWQGNWEQDQDQNYYQNQSWNYYGGWNQPYRPMPPGPHYPYGGGGYGPPRPPFGPQGPRFFNRPPMGPYGPPGMQQYGGQQYYPQQYQQYQYYPQYNQYGAGWNAYGQQQQQQQQQYGAYPQNQEYSWPGETGQANTQYTQPAEQKQHAKVTTSTVTRNVITVPVANIPVPPLPPTTTSAKQPTLRWLRKAQTDSTAVQSIAPSNIPLPPTKSVTRKRPSESIDPVDKSPSHDTTPKLVASRSELAAQLLQKARAKMAATTSSSKSSKAEELPPMAEELPPMAEELPPMPPSAPAPSAPASNTTPAKKAKVDTIGESTNCCNLSPQLPWLSMQFYPACLVGF